MSLGATFNGSLIHEIGEAVAKEVRCLGESFRVFEFSCLCVSAGIMEGSGNSGSSGSNVFVLLFRMMFVLYTRGREFCTRDCAHEYK